MVIEFLYRFLIKVRGYFTGHLLKLVPLSLAVQNFPSIFYLIFSDLFTDAPSFLKESDHLFINIV